MRILIDVMISAFAATAVDVVICILCKKLKIFVVDMPVKVAYPDTGRISSLSGKDSIVYRIFGFDIQFELVVILVVTALAVFMTVFMLLTRSIITGAEQILEGIRQVTEGHYDYRIQVRGHNELSSIAEGLNQLAEESARMKRQAEEAETTKNDLITNVAHDLRTPLTSIIGYIDLLNTRADLTEEQKRKYLQIASDKAGKLQQMINELFDFTKMSYSHMPLQLMRVDMVRLIEQAVDELYPVFEEHHLSCRLETDVSSLQMECDPAQIARLLDNLLGNAIRYGAAGKLVEVITETTGESISIRVINYGSVIPKENMPYLFEKFYKADTSRTPESKGTGLGLAIAKTITEMHGGQIRAESSLKGTVFEVTLPIR